MTEENGLKLNLANCDRAIHEPVRLTIMSLLCRGYQPDYRYLKTALGVTDGNLASHLRTLEEAGYVQAEKRFVGRRPNTIYITTPRGKEAFEEHRKKLLSILLPGQAASQEEQQPLGVATKPAKVFVPDPVRS